MVRSYWGIARQLLLIMAVDPKGNYKQEYKINLVHMHVGYLITDMGT